MLSTVRIGMVGAGAVAARHVRTLLAMEGVEVAAVADPALERAEELAAEAGAAAYPNHMELLSSERLDAVYICVPPFAHGAPELAVIDAGLPMFVEKPVAIDQETAATIADRLAGRSLVTCTGYHWRWLDIFDRAADLLADRPARLVQCSWLDKVPSPPWWLRRDGSGGQTIEQTTHVLDTARGLAGDVVEVHSYGSRAAANPPTGGSAGPRTGRVAQDGNGGSRLSTAPAGAATAPTETAPAEAALPAADIHDVSVASLRFASGAVGTVASTCLLPRLQRAGVHLVADGLSLELSETELVVEADGRRQAWTADADARPRPDRDFMAAVRGGEDRIRVPWPEAYRTHLLACAITRSAGEGRPVPVEGSGEPQRGAPVDREGSGEPQRGAPVEWGRPTVADRRPVRLLVIERPGVARLVEEDEPAPAGGQFRVDTLYTGLSAGTELTYFKGTNPYLHAAWDERLGVFRRDRPATGFPVRAPGYMEVGRVCETSSDAVAEGDLVAMAYGHRTAHTVDPAVDRFLPLPPDLDPVLGIYVAHMGPICANGLLHAAADTAGPGALQLGDGVRGRHVLVTGAGVVGLLVALLARHHGAAEVVVADATPARLAAAKALGLDAVDDAEGTAWRTVKERWRRDPTDCGADVVFQCRGRTAALAGALRSLRPQGTVIDLAFYQGGAPDLALGEEFHHNGLSIRCAQIGRVPRGMAHLWDRRRLAAETVELLRASGPAMREHLVTDLVPLDDAPALLADLASRRRHVLQAVFACPAATA